MNKNYKEALVKELVEQENIANVTEVTELVDTCEEELTGSWVDDLEEMRKAWYDLEEEKAKENQIEEIVEGLKVGVNFVSGLGVGVARNEEDLEAMKKFVRAALVMKDLFSI